MKNKLPGTLCNTYKVDLARPREPTDRAFLRLRQQIIVGAGNQILLKCFQDTADGKGAGGVGAVSRTAAIGAAGIIGQLRENGN